MIRDEETLKEVRSSWDTVRLTQAKVKANLSAAVFGEGGVPITTEFMDLTHSLVLLFAYSVLEDVLRALKGQGEFKCGERSPLGGLMECSRQALKWRAYDRVYEGKEARNRIAHDQKFPPRKATWGFIDAIEEELVSWGVLKGPVNKVYFARYLRIDH